MQRLLSSKVNKMNEPIAGWKALTGFLTLLIGICAMWMSLSAQYRQDGKDFENHEGRIKRLEDDKKEIIRYIEKVEGKVDDVSKQNTQILILLENKANRK